MKKNIVILIYEIEGNLWNELVKNFINKTDYNFLFIHCDIWSWTDYSKFSKIYPKFVEVINFGELLEKNQENQVLIENNAFNIALKKDPILNQYVHDRKAYKNNYNPIKLQFTAQKILQIIDDFKPQMIITYNNQYFLKNFIWENLKNKYSFKTIIASRFTDGDKILISETFGHGYNKLLPNKNDELLMKLKLDLLTKNSLYFVSYNQFKKLPNLISVIKSTFFQIYQDLISYKKRNKIDFGPKFGLMPLIELQMFSRHIFAYKKLKKIAKHTVQKNSYLYFCHLSPEGGGIMSNSIVPLDLWHIELISSYLPSDSKLYVRENPQMFGVRNPEFYNKINSILNVHFISNEESSVNLIQQCKGVIGVSGTNLVEAVLLEKPVLVLGDPEFINQDYDNLLGKINKYFSTDTNKNDNDEIQKYISETYPNIFDLKGSVNLLYFGAKNLEQIVVNNFWNRIL